MPIRYGDVSTFRATVCKPLACVVNTAKLFEKSRLCPYCGGRLQSSLGNYYHIIWFLWCIHANAISLLKRWRTIDDTENEAPFVGMLSVANVCSSLLVVCMRAYKKVHSISCSQVHRRSSANGTEHSSTLIRAIIADTNRRRRTGEQRERRTNWNICICLMKYVSITNDDKNEKSVHA